MHSVTQIDKYIIAYLEMNKKSIPKNVKHRISINFSGEISLTKSSEKQIVSH